MTHKPSFLIYRGHRIELVNGQWLVTRNGAAVFTADCEKDATAWVDKWCEQRDRNAMRRK